MRSSIFFHVPIYVRKYTIDRWIVVYTVCASAVISPIRQWLDSYAKIIWKCVTGSSILFICNTFCCWLILLLSLYVGLALVCCTNPDNVHCFGTIFPNLNFVFASICAAPPVHIQSKQYRSCSSVKQQCVVSVLLHSWWGATKNSAVTKGSRNDTISIHQRVRRRMKQNNADLKLLENCVMNGFTMFDIMFMTATGLENLPQSFDVYTVSQSCSMVMSAENPAPENSPQSIDLFHNIFSPSGKQPHHRKLAHEL